MKTNYNLEETYDRLEEISSTFIMFLEILLEISKCKQINFVGLGNSISAGWTATDNDVRPWLEKLRPFLESKSKKAGVPLNFGTFSIAGHNSNQEIYEFLKGNPSEADVKKHFIEIFDEWKKEFQGTMFENYVEKEIALSYYADTNKTFLDFYKNDIFTISSFHGCTGELLDHIGEIFYPGGFQKIFDKELLYLQKIIQFLTKISDHSYLTIGNFPKIGRKSLFVLNYLTCHINKQIEMLTASYDNVMYFDGIYLDLIHTLNGKIKIDNHPNLERQYRSLYHYLVFLMDELPRIMMEKENGYTEQYKKLESIKKIKQKVLK